MTDVAHEIEVNRMVAEGGRDHDIDTDLAPKTLFAARARYAGPVLVQISTNMEDWSIRLFPTIRNLEDWCATVTAGELEEAKDHMKGLRGMDGGADNHVVHATLFDKGRPQLYENLNERLVKVPADFWVM